MRNIVEVIDQIIEVAPDLKDVIGSVRGSVMYAAPEMMPLWWDFVAERLNTFAHDHPKRDEIVAIFSGKRF